MFPEFDVKFGITIHFLNGDIMKKLLFFVFAVFMFNAIPAVYADELPEVPPVEEEQVPPLDAEPEPEQS